MATLTACRAFVLLGVACGLFLAADAVPKPVALEAPSARLTSGDVQDKVAVPLLRKLAKNYELVNEYVLFGTVHETDVNGRTFQKASDIFDSSLLEDLTETLIEDITEEELELLSTEIPSVTAQELHAAVTELWGTVKVQRSQLGGAFASKTTALQRGTDRAVQPGLEDTSERIIVPLMKGLKALGKALKRIPIIIPVNGNGKGDPHLTGFDGRRFLLSGDTVHEYNLFSAENVSLNSRMYEDNDKKTFFRQFRLDSGGDSLLIDMDPTQKTVSVTVNGVLLDRDDLRDTGNMSVTTQPVGKTNLKVSVSTTAAAFTFDTLLYKRPHLDFSLELTRYLGEDEADGILGHTLHRRADVPHPADMAEDELAARYAVEQLTVRVAGTA